jgi:hypothetical protein
MKQLKLDKFSQQRGNNSLIISSTGSGELITNYTYYQKLDTNINSTLNYRDKKGNPNVFLLPDSEHLCDPNHDKFIHRDTTKFLKVKKSLNPLQ